MKFLKVAGVAFLMLVFALTGTRATAQGFGIGVSNAPGTHIVSNSVTYTLFVTNLSTTGAEIQVTNLFSRPVQLVSSSNGFFNAGTASNVNGALVFDMGFSFNIGNFAVLTLTVTPTNTGFLTNIVSVGAVNISNTAVFVTNVLQVTNLSTTLSSTAGFPTNTVLQGDYLAYTLTVTNPGANTATGVILSNYLPAGAILIEAIPTNLTSSNVNGAQVFNLGNVASHGSVDLTFIVEPTAVGTNLFINSISSQRSPTVFLTNAVVVEPLDTSQLVAANASAMTYNPQTGLMQQTIQLSNIGTNIVLASRVIVSGLTNLLYNAVGINDGDPYVEYAAPLAPGASVNLVLEYFVPTRQPITVDDSAYIAVPGPQPDLTPPSGSTFAITLITNLPSGNIMIEFPATTGNTYTIIYADNPQMTNAMQAEPPVTAPGDRVQWIDDGPPKTISVPASAGSRFYQVFQNN